MLRYRRTWLAAFAAGALVLASCGVGSGGSDQKVSLVAYSATQAAYEQITEAFQRTPQGANVAFTKSFGASGDQSRAVAAGLPADFVAFSLEPDMTRLVNEKIVAADWNKDEYNGMVTESVVVIGVRKGNPKGIRTWEDLTEPGIEVITPNPFASGGARWNVMAAYGAASDKGMAEQDGVDFLDRLFANVPVQDDSARKSLQTFAIGKGDAILAYENEMIFAQQKGAELDYVIPDETILIENPAAVPVTSKHPTEAKAFLDYVRTPEAQEIFVKNGYRPTAEGVPGADEFPTPSGLFTIEDLGGWTEVAKKFFDPKSSIMADVERHIGVSVQK
jgi:sulfate/thiosulfate transport system substrate-binding protein